MSITLLLGIPGGPELLMALFLALFIAFLVALVFVSLRSLVRFFGGSNDTRVRELERRVEQLESERERD